MEEYPILLRVLPPAASGLGGGPHNADIMFYPLGRGECVELWVRVVHVILFPGRLGRSFVDGAHYMSDSYTIKKNFMRLWDKGL